MRVLIAEDDPVSQKVLCATVERLGHEWVAADDGLAAWQAYQAGEFEVVLTDWMMPVLDGVELCRRIRAVQADAQRLHPGIAKLLERPGRGQRRGRGRDGHRQIHFRRVTNERKQIGPF